MVDPMTEQTGFGETYILCDVCGTTYALRSAEIEQLEMVGQLTPVPNAPACLDGVTSVRGQVIPAMSLRARFGFPRVPYDIRSRLVVVRHRGRSVGLIADSAREFASIAPDAIHAPPETLAETSGEYIRGVTHLGDRLVLLLDVAGVLDLNNQRRTLPATAETAVVAI